MKTNLIYNQNFISTPKSKINFKGENFSEYVGNTKLIHETSFFREPETDEFVKDYIEKEFLLKGKPVNIAVVSIRIKISKN